MLLILRFGLSLFSLEHFFYLFFVVLDLAFEFMAVLLELVDPLCHLGLSLFRLQCFPHSKRYATLEQRLVGLNCHFDFIFDSGE